MAPSDQATEQDAHYTEAEPWQENEPQIHTELWEELENNLYVELHLSSRFTVANVKSKYLTRGVAQVFIGKM